MDIALEEVHFWGSGSHVNESMTSTVQVNVLLFTISEVSISAIGRALRGAIMSESSFSRMKLSSLRVREGTEQNDERTYLRVKHNLQHRTRHAHMTPITLTLFLKQIYEEDFSEMPGGVTREGHSPDSAART